MYPLILLVISGRVWYHLRSRGFFPHWVFHVNIVCALFSHFYFIVLDCGIIIVCLIGLVIFAHLTTQREKVCVLYRLFSQHSGIKSLVYIFLGDTLVLVYDG